MTESGAASAAVPPGLPAFAAELAGTLSVHSQYVLHGNLRDLFLLKSADGPVRPVSLLPLLWRALAPRGYECFIRYDPVDGLTVFPDDSPTALAAAQRLLGPRALGRRPSLERLRAHLARVVGVPAQPPAETAPAGTAAAGDAGPAGQPAQGADPAGSVARRTVADAAAPGYTAARARAAVPAVRAAFVIDYAARLTRVPGTLDPAERDFFLYCQKLALTAARPALGGPDRLYNPLIWLVEGERDLPPWLTADVEPIRTVAVGLPTRGDRQVFARGLVRDLPGGDAADSGQLAKAQDQFEKRTDGMTLRSMSEIIRLSKDRAIPVDRVNDAVRIYKLGMDDNPWRQDSVRANIVKGEAEIAERVRGQHQAVSKTLDILKRAALGLSGAQATSSGTRPRGVLFFAGPTGVGKTELAKQVAGLLFGTTESYLRFDMSEFAADHAADRLIGAPPGYVGFEAGGELTGAVRRNPFQVVLFDEIEKAHKLVLDKFLQILEDGRLTDGQGVTTYFSECVLIFTSNLGVIRTDPKTDERVQLVQPGIPYRELEDTITREVRNHFTVQLGRPELLNRLGDNIVVFDFISRDVAGEICALQLTNIVEAVHRELELTLELTEAARAQLTAACTEDLAHGGRGIGNRLESRLINPLARVLFDRQAPAGTRVLVTGVRPGDALVPPTVEVDITGGGR